MVIKNKILILSNHSIVVYNFHKELVQELLTEGYQVFLSLPYDKRVAEMIEWGCRHVETVVDRRGMNFRRDLHLYRKYKQIIEEIEPAVVLTFTVKPNIYGGLVCQKYNIPYVVNVTGLGTSFQKKFLLTYLVTKLSKASFKKADIIFFQNEKNQQILREANVLEDVNSEVLPGAGVNLLDYSYSELPPKDPIIFLFAGRIMQEKGIDNYLEAAKLIKTKYPHTRFDVIGFIEETDSHYKEILEQYQVSGYVNYLGFQQDVKPYFERAHCLVQPSYHEGLSNVLLEAAALGRILIASNIPGCREVVDVGKNGFTFTAGSTEALVDCLERFLQLSSTEMNAMSANSRKKVENDFNRDIVVDAYMERVRQFCT